MATGSSYTSWVRISIHLSSGSSLKHSTKNSKQRNAAKKKNSLHKNTLTSFLKNHHPNKIWVPLNTWWVISILALEGNSKVLPFIIIQWQQSPLYFGCNVHQVQVNKLLVAADHCRPRSLFSIYHDLILPKYFGAKSQVLPFNCVRRYKSTKSSSSLSVPHLLSEFLRQDTIPHQCI